MADPAVRTHKALSDVSRFRILEELRAGGPKDAHQLGQQIGLHPNTIRSHADQLIRAQLVRTMTASALGRGRPRVLYEAVADPQGRLESGYQLLAQILTSCLASIDQAQPAAESAGRNWGNYLAEKPPPFSAISADEATQKVVGLMSELGFMPEAVAEPAGRRVLFHRCPYRQVAESNEEIVCSVHLGMLKGALAEMGAPIEAIRIEPFLEPTLCVAHLRDLSPKPARAQHASAKVVESLGR